VDPFFVNLAQDLDSLQFFVASLNASLRGFLESEMFALNIADKFDALLEGNGAAESSLAVEAMVPVLQELMKKHPDAAIRLCGDQTVSIPLINLLLDSFDRDRNGVIDRAEFLELTKFIFMLAHLDDGVERTRPEDYIEESGHNKDAPGESHHREHDDDGDLEPRLELLQSRAAHKQMLRVDVEDSGTFDHNSVVDLDATSLAEKQQHHSDVMRALVESRALVEAESEAITMVQKRDEEQPSSSSSPSEVRKQGPNESPSELREQRRGIVPEEKEKLVKKNEDSYQVAGDAPALAPVYVEAEEKAIASAAGNAEEVVTMTGQRHRDPTPVETQSLAAADLETDAEPAGTPERYNEDQTLADSEVAAEEVADDFILRLAQDPEALAEFIATLHDDLRGFLFSENFESSCSQRFDSLLSEYGAGDGAEELGIELTSMIFVLYNLAEKNTKALAWLSPRDGALSMPLARYLLDCFDRDQNRTIDRSEYLELNRYFFVLSHLNDYHVDNEDQREQQNYEEGQNYGSEGI